MDLADRRCGDRFRIPLQERLVGRASELALDDLGGEFGAHRWSAGLERGQRLAHGLRQPVVHVARHLPDLHQRALHAAEALGNLLGGPQPTRVVQLSPSFGRREELARLGGGVGGADRHTETGDGRVACGARGVADGSAMPSEPPGRGGKRQGEREDGPLRSSQIVSTSRTRTRNSPFGAS